MAILEQNPVQQRIPRSRSDRLADQAATAALYVTHPERSLSVRSPTAELDAAPSKTGPNRLGLPELSNASAAAALIAHRKQEPGLRHTALVSHADRRRAASPRNEGYPYQAAMYAIKEQNAPETQGTRRRAESAPNEAARARASASARASMIAAEGAKEVKEDPFEDLDAAMKASRIQHAHMNPKLFTATPPVAPEVEEYRRKSILEAASMSMAKDIYSSMERDSGSQRHPTVRSIRSVSISKTDPATLQHASTMMLSQALNLQDVAQKRAAERLAVSEDEQANYRDYYGVQQQANRSSLTIRRRRGSNETEHFDQERSKEIRTQMSTLRSRLNAVDEKRENDRASLLELARKNVDAAIQDMDERILNEGGDSVVMQKYLEERAAERAQKGIQDIDAQYLLANKINIGGRRYVEMSDVEDLARSRLQPTFDEIDDIAETQRARDLEARLDEEQRQRLAGIEAEREADIKAEEEKHLEALKQDQKAKQELKSKEEKVWPWKRKSKTLHRTESGADKNRQPADSTNGAAAFVSGAAQPEARPQIQPDTRTEISAEPSTETQPVPREPTRRRTEETDSQTDSVAKRESRFKNWFKDKLSRRSSAPPKQTNGAESAQDTTVVAGAGAERGESSEDTGRGGSESDNRDESRSAALRSNPVTAEDLNRRAERASYDEGADNHDGGTPTKYTTAEDSEATASTRQREQADSVHELPAPMHEKEDVSTTEPLPAPPSMGEFVNRRRASSGTVRESRFSEDL